MVANIGVREKIFGYYLITIDTEHLKDAASLLIKLGLSASLSSKGILNIGIKDATRFIAVAPKEWIIRVSAPLGLFGVLLSYRKSVGAIVGCFIALLLYIFLGSLVWDVRIEGNTYVSDARIVDALEEVGFGLGSVFSFVDIDKTETELLSVVDDISWVSINRKGTVAYVVLKEKAQTEEIPKDENILYSDIIAKSDGVVSSITVKSGTPLIKVGDTVKAGETLIGGYVEIDGKVFPTRAEGEVLAESWGEISVFVAKKEESKSTFIGEYCGLKIKIFSIYINLLKNSGKTEKDCDIIEDEEVCMLFGRYRLPLSFTRVYTVGAEIRQVEYSESEIVEIASERMKRAMSSYLASGEIVKLRSRGDFSDGGYRLTNYLVFIDGIGEEKIIVKDTEEKNSD